MITHTQHVDVVDRAIQEGRHSSTCQSICGGCGQWTSEIYGLVDRSRLCARCSWKVGQIDHVLAFHLDVIDRPTFDRIQSAKLNTKGILR